MDNMNSILETIVHMRGGISERCDFCKKEFTKQSPATPEEGGLWACLDCVKRWEIADKVKEHKL